VNNKKLVKLNMSLTTADEATAKLFHPKHEGEACCVKEEDASDESIETLCYECYNVGWVENS